MADLFAGLDVSTQSCKLVVIRPDDGAVVHMGRVEYDRDLPAYGTLEGTTTGLGEGVSESEPPMWTDAVELILGRLRGAGVRTECVRCVSVSGQQHGLVALAAAGRLARPRAKLWNDFSTAEECRILTEAVGGLDSMIAEVGNSQRTGYTAPKILHMRRHEPDRYERATTLFLVHNYINWWLTGGPDGGVAVMEPGDVSGMALWHPGTGQWSSKVLDAIAPDLREKLPPVEPSDRTIGTISAELANRYGFPIDCKIDAGSGDNMYGAIGTGNFEPGIVTVSLGTSGTAYTFLQIPPGRLPPSRTARAITCPCCASRTWPTDTTRCWSGWSSRTRPSTDWLSRRPSEVTGGWCCRGTWESARRTCPRQPRCISASVSPTSRPRSCAGRFSRGMS